MTRRTIFRLLLGLPLLPRVFFAPPKTIALYRKPVYEHEGFIVLGEAEWFATLAEAYAAANDGSTIRIFSDPGWHQTLFLS